MLEALFFVAVGAVIGNKKNINKVKSWVADLLESVSEDEKKDN